MIQTNRNFTDVETGDVFRLYTSKDNSVYHLIAENNTNKVAPGTEVNGFYISAHTSQHIKIDGKKIVYLPIGSFYNMKQGEKITHKKYTGFNKFTKV